jgi:cytochrome c biogenesis protein CcdA/thiol-disulfide isomerase/thioredoxin
MVLYILCYLAGILTIVSPCILPVLPFVFARADRPFLRSGLPMLVGMAVTFAAVATMAAVAGGWAVTANQYGRSGALALLALFGLALLFPGVADRLMRPLVTLGARLSSSSVDALEHERSSILPSFLLGIATGLLWAPCAGPVLGLVLTGAALKGASVQTSLLLLAFAGGAATSLALALLVGGKVFDLMKRSLGAGEWIRRTLGAAVLTGVVTIALGLDTGLLTRLSTSSTASVEQRLLDRFHTAHAQPSDVMKGTATMTAIPAKSIQAMPAGQVEDLPIEGTLPSLAGAVAWLNSPPLSGEALKGKVVLVDFWTYSCINCLRTIPYVKAWAEKYRDQGLVVIGVHAPEFAFEKNIDNVRKAVSELKIDYPVAIDNDYAIWRAFDNEYWPAHYFIDAQGRIRHHHFGEGAYDKSEQVIQQLLAEAGKKAVPAELTPVTASGVEAAPDTEDVGSEETYIGYDRAVNFVSPGGPIQDVPHVYSATTTRVNELGLVGDWTVGAEQARLNKAGGSIVFRFHARDLHLVLGPGPDGKPSRFRVTIDGKPPRDDHGTDVDASGEGTVAGERLYQLVRQNVPLPTAFSRSSFSIRGSRPTPSHLAETTSQR